MCLLGKEQILFSGDLLPTVHTPEKLWHQPLLCHSSQFKNAPYQPVIDFRIQESLHSEIKKIHHILLICALSSEIICQLQKVIAIINSRLSGGQLHKMMGHGHLVQIVAAAPFIQGEIPEHKRIDSCHKRAVLPSGTLGESRNLPPLPGKKHDPLVILSHRLRRKYNSLYRDQITHF